MAGQGFALLTPLLWKGDVAAGRLRMPFPDRRIDARLGLLAGVPEGAAHGPKVKRFREWLVSEIRQALAEFGIVAGLTGAVSAGFPTSFAN